MQDTKQDTHSESSPPRLQYETPIRNALRHLRGSERAMATVAAVGYLLLSLICFLLPFAVFMGRRRSVRLEPPALLILLIGLALLARAIVLLIGAIRGRH